MTYFATAFLGAGYLFGTVLMLCLSVILPLCAVDFVVAKVQKLRRRWNR